MSIDTSYSTMLKKNCTCDTAAAQFCKGNGYCSTPDLEVRKQLMSSNSDEA